VVESCHNAKRFGLPRQHHMAGTTEEEINGRMAFTGKMNVKLASELEKQQ